MEFTDIPKPSEEASPPPPAEGASEESAAAAAPAAPGGERISSLSPKRSMRHGQHRDPTVGAGESGWRARKPLAAEAGQAKGLADFAEQVNRLSPEEESRVRAQSLSPVGSFFYGAQAASESNPFAEKDKVEPVMEPPQATLQRYLTIGDEAKLYNSANLNKRPDVVAIRRYRVILVGAGEAGKTSLRKCFASNPLFFKNLPEVGTTTGIDIQKHRTKVTGDSHIDIEINDFAGQEVYHSHSLFLTNRSMFLFVWNMSNVEQTFDDYGISAAEEARLKQWADVVQSKCPGAPIVVIGTHKDQLRDASPKTVTLILNKVCKIITDYVDTLKHAKDVRNISVGGSFCVSCRDRSVIPENTGGPVKMKDLFQWVAELCHKYSKTDTLFKNSCVPRYIVSLIATLEKMKTDMETVLLPMKAYNALCKQLGIPKELLHKITQMLHDWGVLYLFDRSALKIGKTDCVFLHPQWLSMMVASVFTYAHACTAPDYERATMEVADMDLDACDAIEPSKLILEGVLCHSLALTLFSRVLTKLKRDSTPQNIEICFTMLRNLDLIYKNTGKPEEGPYLVAHSVTPVGDQYYVPSIFPRACPRNMDVHISRLVRNKGRHSSCSLTPLPKEFVHHLHTRVSGMLMRLDVNAPCTHRDPPTKVVSNVWRDAWWVAGGGGEGGDFGIGPIRALAVADLEGRRIDMYAIGGNRDDPRMMSLGKVWAHFLEAVNDLAAKYPGIYVEDSKPEASPSEELEDETFVVLTSCMRPPEVRFLMESFGFVPTEAQTQKLAELESAMSSGTEPTSPVGQMKTSLLLDKMVRACMLQDSSIVTA